MKVKQLSMKVRAERIKERGERESWGMTVELDGMRASIDNMIQNYNMLVNEQYLDADTRDYLVTRLAQAKIDMIKAERMLEQVYLKLNENAEKEVQS